MGRTAAVASVHKKVRFVPLVFVDADTGAASLATSLPRFPGATRTWAAVKAGASFTPSPVMATTLPSRFSASTKRSLRSGWNRTKRLLLLTLRARAHPSSASSLPSSRHRCRCSRPRTSLIGSQQIPPLAGASCRRAWRLRQLSPPPRPLHRIAVVMHVLDHSAPGVCAGGSCTSIDSPEYQLFKF